VCVLLCVREKARARRACVRALFGLNFKSDSLSTLSADSAVDNLLIAVDLWVTSGRRWCGDGGGSARRRDPVCETSAMIADNFRLLDLLHGARYANFFANGGPTEPYKEGTGSEVFFGTYTIFIPMVRFVGAL